MSMDPGAAQQGQQAFVQITLGQVYSEVTGMRAEIRDLASSLRAITDQGRDHEARLRALEKAQGPLDDVPDRLTSVERRVWTASGMAMLVGGGIGAAATLWAGSGR